MTIYLNWRPTWTMKINLVTWIFIFPFSTCESVLVAQFLFRFEGRTKCVSKLKYVLDLFLILHRCQNCSSKQMLLDANIIGYACSTSLGQMVFMIIAKIISRGKMRIYWTAIWSDSCIMHSCLSPIFINLTLSTAYFQVFWVLKYGWRKNCFEKKKKDFKKSCLSGIVLTT